MARAEYFLTSKQVSQRVGLSTSRINYLAYTKQIRAKKIGRFWYIPNTEIPAIINRVDGRKIGKCSVEKDLHPVDISDNV